MINVKKLKLLFILAAAITAGALSLACFNPISVDNCGYVVAVGADIGMEKTYEITFELQRESAGESAENSGGALLLSVEADDIFSAIDELSSGIPYKLNFTRTHIFVFGEELARSGGITDFLDMSFDVLRIRRSALMIVSKAPVRDYFGGLVANNNANIAKMQDALISNVERTGEIAAVNVSLFLEACDEARFDPVMPLGDYEEGIITDTKQFDSTKKGENPIKDAKKGERIGGMKSLTVGAAVFDGNRMVGILDGFETQIMNIVRGDFCEGRMNIEIDNRVLCVFAANNKRRIRMKLDGEGASAEVEIKLNITIERDPTNRVAREFDQGEGKKLEEYLEREFERVFLKLKSLRSDAMGFGRSASMLFNDIDAYERFDWKDAYQRLKARFSVELSLDDRYLASHRQ